jgi:hypothetical protein
MTCPGTLPLPRDGTTGQVALGCHAAGPEMRAHSGLDSMLLGEMMESLVKGQLVQASDGQPEQGGS